ncbi:1-(5-phosphoribosyl)-5-amino-4-imidazole- carboxylate (AIR) carboxylase [Candidatus Magnetoovum chiemensis]|nr:1-(5-phosphoribosyl)-5-amino-4-imidazole- carboxylate (AIR) carboxylase [Candidatus Magnetoovum chiemensis]
MFQGDLERLLNRIKDGEISIADAMDKLKHLPYEDLKYAKIDHHRHLSSGIMEVVYGEGKRAVEVVEIARRIYDKSNRVLITRADENIYKALDIKDAQYYPASRVIRAGDSPKQMGSVLVVCAGTADIPVAEEAQQTAQFLGSNASVLHDIGVAGLHRIIVNIDVLKQARVIVVAAGMEGALPSVIGGLIDKPIIAVPTSIGYGTALGGLTALFSMLNSCVPGIAVMNIDNGFGAGCLAHKINTLGLNTN